MLGRLILVGVVLALAAGCGSTPTSPTSPPPPPVEPPPPPPPPGPVYSLGVSRILAFGDSMTYGVTPPPGLRFTLDAGIPLSYPFKLQALMGSRYTAQSVQLFNAGEGGKRVDEDRIRFGDRIKESNPQLILLMEGANDLNNIAAAAAAGVPGTNQLVDTVVGMMEDMVRDAVERRGIPVFLATLPPQRLPKGSATEFLPRYNNGLKTMAAKKGATLVDFGALIPISMISSDGLHPSEAGYQRMAELFFEAIKTKYEAAAPTLLARPARP